MRAVRQTLRNRLVVAFLGPMLVVVLLYGVTAYFATRSALEEELGQRLIGVAQATAADMSESIDAKQLGRLDPSKVRVRKRIRERLVRVKAATGVRRVFVFSADGAGLVDTREDVEFGSKLYRLEADRTEIEQSFRDKRGTASVLFEGDDGELYKSAYAPITVDGEPVAALGVEASAQYFTLLNQFGAMLTLLGVFALLLIIGVATIFSRQLTAPLGALVEEARRLGRGDWDDPVTAAGIGARGDEFEFLATAFDEMRSDILNRDRQMQMMLSGIAHEVRNPLGGMELFLGLLREDLEATDPSDPEMLDKVAKIQRELDYLERVVTDFLEFARHLPLDAERFDGKAFVDEVTTLLASDVDDAGCVIVGEAEEGVELTGDRQKLRRAAINLVRNAYQACKASGGTITVAARADGERRIVEIRDDGPGIPADKLAEILTPFFTTKERGSGLGLSLSQRIVERHRGEMKVESEVGKGTVVSFELPFDPDLEAQAMSQDDIPEGWLG